MAGELRQKQFVNEEVYPVIRETIPSMLERLVALEEAIAELEGPKAKGTTVSFQEYNKAKAEKKKPAGKKAKPKAKK